MSVYKGQTLTLSIFGASHGPSIGMTLSGIPSEGNINLDVLHEFMARRAPGNSLLSTSRKEPDQPEFVSGLMPRTSGDAEILTPRPGHADYTAHVKYGGTEDSRGGGAFSGRMTAPLCIAGGICKQLLAERGIYINASIHDIHGNAEDPLSEIKKAQVLRDSVGGTILCTISGLDAGYGGPLFEGLEGRIAEIVYAIPAVKGIEFGAGFESTRMYGSENNDEFYYDERGTVCTRTTNCGISDGMDIEFRVAIKPTPSIARPQKTIVYDSTEEAVIEVHGRHDPCIVPRAVPCVEAAAAVVITDLVLTERTASSTVSKESNDLTTVSPTSASSFGLVSIDLSHLRSSIDEIDLQLLALIERRLKITESVAEYKKENNLGIIDSNREASLLKRIRSLSSDDLADLNEDIFKAIIRASCKHQKKFLK